MTHPAAVTACNLDLENLITDVNRSIATLAITTLLKVGVCCLCTILLPCLDCMNFRIILTLKSYCQYSGGRGSLLRVILLKPGQNRVLH